MTSDALDAGGFWRRFGLLKFNDQDTMGAVDRLHAELQRFRTGLGVEVSEPDAAGVRELVVTANGDSTLFPTVDELLLHAPDLENWRFIGLKPGLGFDFVHRRDGVLFDPASMWFEPLSPGDESDAFGLAVMLPPGQAEPSERAVLAVWNLLETALGERVVSERIHHVEVRECQESDRNGRLALSDVGAYLAWLDRRAESG